MQPSKIYCFRASYELSTNFHPRQIPDWLCLESDWQGYRITTDPWVADVARLLGILQAEDTVNGWITHLEELGLREVRQISGEEFFESKGFS